MTQKDIAEATRQYPRFSDGRIDYTNERVCYVANCVVLCGDEVLLTRRGPDVIAYPNAINGISGFIDDPSISIREMILGELREELQAPGDAMKYLEVSKPFIQIDEDINREWHVFAALAEFKEKFQPITNWENKSATWYKLHEARHMELMRGFRKTLETALRMRRSG